MNFFKSILSDDPEPVNMSNFEKSDETADEIVNPTSSGEAPGGGLWSFGDLVKNLTAQSESVLETDDEGDEEQLTNSNSNSNYSGENDVVDDVSNSGGGGLWRFGDLVKTITTKSESVLETYSPNHQFEGGDEEQLTNSNSNPDVSNVGGGGLWRFGDLVKNLSNKSESVLETYRRDLKEFGSGLKKESDLFREAANRAVKELPETMKKSISQGKPSASSDVVVDDSDVKKVYYSRFDSQLNAMQNDVETYCKDPEDNLDEYNKWKLGFMLSENASEIEKLIGENGIVEGMYKKVVPNEVDEGSFWCRYFYKVYKLKQQEDVRASFVRRSLNVDDEEELSWDVDDDEQEEEEAEIEEKRNLNDESKTVNPNVGDDGMAKNNDLKLSGGDVSDEKVGLLPKTDENDDHGEKAHKDVSNDKVESVLKTDENHDISKIEAKDVSYDKVELVPKTGENHDHSENAGKEVCDEKVESVLKIDENLDIGKSVKSSLQEEEDLEWDEIGDIGENDEKNVSQSEITPKKGEVCKRLSNTAEDDDDEDLSWDIEDDDEPVKAGNSK